MRWRMPVTSLQAISGCASQKGRETRPAASPTISTACGTARASASVFSSSSALWSPSTLMAAWAASRMSRSRWASSLRDILFLRILEDLVAEVAAELLGRAQIDAATEKLAELLLHARHREVADRGLGLELDQHVDVALGAEIVAKHRAEERQAPDAAAAAELADALVIDAHGQAHGRPPKVQARWSSGGIVRDDGRHA